jgi:hypothetical protein
VAVFHHRRRISQTHVVAPVQLCSDGDGTVGTWAIAHPLTEDTPGARLVGPYTPPPAVGSTPLHLDGHAVLAVLEPVHGRDPTHRDESRRNFRVTFRSCFWVPVTSKLSALVAVPPGVVTAMGPSVAPAGTVAVICVSRFTVKLADVPLKVTAVAPVNPVPVIATEVPTGPLSGRTRNCPSTQQIPREF